MTSSGATKSGMASTSLQAIPSDNKKGWPPTGGKTKKQRGQVRFFEDRKKQRGQVRFFEDRANPAYAPKERSRTVKA
jgi:hypothetical protein